MYIIVQFIQGFVYVCFVCLFFQGNLIPMVSLFQILRMRLCSRFKIIFIILLYSTVLVFLQLYSQIQLHQGFQIVVSLPTIKGSTCFIPDLKKTKLDANSVHTCAVLSLWRENLAASCHSSSVTSECLSKQRRQQGEIQAPVPSLPISLQQPKLLMNNSEEALLAEKWPVFKNNYSVK